jgi:teichuronic acid biosynthesis glycosyltransferase TuaG
MFSIVMPAFNAAQTIEAAIDSVRVQSDRDWELVVVDDCSSDETHATVERIACEDPRIRYVRTTRNGGVAKARNAGLEAANGRYLAFLDADDLWRPEKLAVQRDAFERGAQVVFGSYLRMLPSGRKQLVTAAARATPRTFLFYNPIGNLTGAYDRALGIVKQQTTRHEDYLMWYELVKRAGYAVGLPAVLAQYTVNTGSLSGNKLKSAVWHWNVVRHGMKAPLPVAVVGFAAYAVRAVSMRLSDTTDSSP